MNEFISALLFYWTSFSDVTQTLIAKIGHTITGREINSELVHWIFYGILMAVMIFLIRARRAKLRNQLATRQRFDI
ncbi:MAG: hypothetical protein L3J33_01550 [Rhodobacteraceae bacterium]|nr:hypothetical protein [Paracoccaceae bacterium]